MSDTKWIIFIAVSGVIIIGGIVYYITSNSPSTSGAGGFPIQVGFPITMWTRSQNVSKLQAALNNSGAGLNVDGIFGPLTLKALQNAGYNVPLSETDFNNIIS